MKEQIFFILKVTEDFGTDPHPDLHPDPLAKGTDPRIWIRIRTLTFYFGCLQIQDCRFFVNLSALLSNSTDGSVTRVPESQGLGQLEHCGCETLFLFISYGSYLVTVPVRLPKLPLGSQSIYIKIIRLLFSQSMLSSNRIRNRRKVHLQQSSKMKKSQSSHKILEIKDFHTIFA